MRSLTALAANKSPFTIFFGDQDLIKFKVL